MVAATPGADLDVGPARHTHVLFRAPQSRLQRPSGSSRSAGCREVTCQARGHRATKLFNKSDGREHLGSALLHTAKRPFPGPPGDEGPPLRVLPIGGLGEIGMNCMLVGVKDRYILIDAGLMFPDFTDLGMQKILPDTSFLAQWRDKIEAVIITHGHEDHIGALPWVVPALDPSTPIYAGGFSMQLIKRRMQEFSLWNEYRFKTFKMRERLQLGPFDCEPIRVTHSIPDCCGLILRSEHGNIVHTGDWKIDEQPIDGEVFDRNTFEQIGREGVALMMSDSTNVLSPGRTKSESLVREALIRRVVGHAGKGRVVTTQFASNLHRLNSVKAAADAAGRQICFIGLSLTTYLEAAEKVGRAPFSPAELVPVNDLEEHDPNKILIVTTGSQAEPRAALSLASRQASPLLRLGRNDLVMYSAKVIPGNETRVTEMMNNISARGPQIAMGPHEMLHTSGHAYQEELLEVMRTVRPQHFLPVHGEYQFLCAHAALARGAGVHNTSVIRNGQMLGCAAQRNGNTVSSGSLAVLGEAKLQLFYNDGEKGTGTADEMGMEERTTLATEGIVIASVDVDRSSSPAPMSRPPADEEASSSGRNQDDELAGAARHRLAARVRITTRAMWTDRGRLLAQLHKAAEAAVLRLSCDANLPAVERSVADALRREAKAYNARKPEVVVVVHEMDARLAVRADSRTAPTRRSPLRAAGSAHGAPARGRGRGAAPARRTASPDRLRSRTKVQGPGGLIALPDDVLSKRRAANPRDNVGDGEGTGVSVGGNIEYP